MFPCEVKHEVSRPTLSIRFRTPVSELQRHLGQVYGAIFGYLAELGQQPLGPAFATYYNMDMNDLDMEAGFIVAQAVPGRGDIAACEMPAGMYAICHYVGAYSGVSAAYQQLTDYAAQHDYVPSGVAYELYYDGPETPPEKTRTDVVFPVMSIDARAPQPH